MDGYFGGYAPAETPDTKSCRACKDFKAFMRTPSKTQSVSQEQQGREEDGKQKIHQLAEESPESYFSRCPLDVEELGKRTWGFLHTMSVYIPEGPLGEAKQSEIRNFMRLFGNLYPCDHCASDFRKDMQKEPPNVDTGSNFADWLCRQHNKVNIKLGKPEFNCDLVYERWRDGPKDGSCG